MRRPAEKMELDRSFVPEEPDTSWSQDTTPGSDDIEIAQQVQEDELPRPPTKNSRSFPRYMRPPIRRRLNIEERLGRGANITNSYTLTTFDMRCRLEGSDASSSSNYTMVTSANTSCTDPWSPSVFVEEEQESSEDQRQDQDKEMQNNDELLVPKLEPIDDDVDMSDMKEGAVSETPSAFSRSPTSPIAMKRPRGRPRKHPKVSPDSIMKLAKGRSKTGCITCRKRKKKCDEAKPGCEYTIVGKDMLNVFIADHIQA